MTASALPGYAALRARTDAPPGSTWWLWGEGNDRGSVNLIDDDARRRALATPRTGRTFGLDLALDELVPVVTHRSSPEQHVFGNGSCHRDDSVRLYSQAGSQIDGLRHVRHPEYGYYGGATADEVDRGERLGIGATWGDAGIVGRGVVIDLPAHYVSTGRDFDPWSSIGIPTTDLQAALDSQGTELHAGDILILYTGWLETLLAADRSASGRAELFGDRGLRSAGLAQGYDTLSWLWDHRIAMVASDNVAVECYPPMPESPLGRELGEGTGLPVGMMHPDLIALLGMCLGELWRLEELVAYCREQSRYECLIVAKPWNLTGGVGSPANAIAIL